MNQDQAIELTTRVIASTTGWTHDAEAELLKEIMSWRDYEAAENAVWWVTHNWAERSRPPLAWIVRAYNEAREAERRAKASEPVHDPYDYIDPTRGRESAFQAYRISLGLPDDAATRERFSTGGVGAWAVFSEQIAPDEDVIIALGTIRGGTTYTEVLRAFGQDHLRTVRALRSLEKGGRVTHRINGWITLR